MKKRDLCYLLFFILHIPIMLIIDLVPLYPSSIQKTFPFLLTIRSWYIETYKDKFFVNPPAWFTFYAWMEAFYHMPVSIWSIGGLIRGDPKIPLVLLPFGMQTAVTTATCIVEYLGWEGYSTQEKIALGGLYGPYLVFALFMTADMYLRLSEKLAGSQTRAKSKRN